MLRHILIAAVLLLPALASAQKPSMKFGKIDQALLTMPSFEGDTSAGALVLGDIGDIRITYDDTYGFRVEFSRHVRIKIFNSNEFDLANFKIHYYSFTDLKEKITRLKATSYNLEGGKVVETDLNKSDTYTDDISSKEKSLNFSVPNVKTGTVFEVEYHLTSDLFGLLPDWDFQYTVPALFSELTVTIPQYFMYKTLMKGYLTPTSTDQNTYGRTILIRDGGGGTNTVTYNENIKKFRFENVPAFKEEPYMNALSNYMSSIEFELASVNFPYSHRDFSTSWAKISKELMQDEDFGIPLKRNCPIKEEAALLRTLYPDPKERMNKAFELVRDAMAYNNHYGIYITTSLRKAWDEKKGKAADINLLLVSLLNELDIEANPVLLSTRNNGIIHPAQIMVNKFNYVIAEARIGDETFLLDATDKKLPPAMLPERCLNGKGRRISLNPELNDWVPLTVNQQNERVFFAQTQLDPTGNIRGDFSLMETSYYAYDRARLIKAENSNDDYASKYEALTPGLVIEEFEIQNLDDRSQPLTLKYKASYNLSDESPKGMIYLNPTLNAGIASNPFISESREFPIDFILPWSSKIINTIVIPEGYEIAELPKNAVLALPNQLGTFRYTIGVNGNQIQVMSTLALKTAQILSENYLDLREFYSRIVAKHAEMVVLKKI